MAIGSRRAGLLGLVILVLIAVAVAWDISPRGYRGADAPSDEFSAVRALDVVDEVAQRPHPVGTDDHTRVRAWLVEQLRGLDVEVQQGVGRWPESHDSGQLGIANVANIVARIPGTDPTGTVYLSAHYDSVPSGPGANDDGVGVASILEAVRALREGPAPRNDVVVLLTDAEERGLLGAEAYVHAGGFGERPSVVINHEARGAKGPVVMWRTTQPDAGMMRIVARAAPHPGADSFASAFAATQTTSDTDFTAFGPAGVSMLDWAYVGGGAYYHNILDDPAHVDLATVQQMGDNSLALAAAFGDADLATLSDDADVGYVGLPGGRLLVFPTIAIVLAAALLVVGFAMLILQARRRGEATVLRIALAAGSALLATLAAVGVAYAIWLVLRLIRPGYGAMVDTYRPGWYYAAMVAVPVAVLLAWYAMVRGRLGPANAMLGSLALVAAGGLVLTAVVPAAAHILVLPALGAVVAGFVVLHAPPRWRIPGVVVCLVPTAFVLSGVVWPSIQLGVATAAFAVAPLAFLLAGLALPLVEATWPQRRAGLVPAVAAALIIVLAAVGLAVDRFDATHPMPAHLSYVLDADTGDATWVSRRDPTRWTDAFVDRSNAPSDVFDGIVASGPAAAEALAAPRLQVVSDTSDSDSRVLRLRIASQRGATSLGLQFPDIEVSALTVAGREITPVPSAGFRFHASAPDGLDVELTVPDRPVTLQLTDFRWLPDSGIASYVTPPDDVFLRQDCESAVTISRSI